MELNHGEGSLLLIMPLKIMEPAGLAFATIATIDLLLQKGSQLARRIEDYKNLKNVVQDIRFLSIESSRTKLREQLLLGQSICKTTTNKDIAKHLDENFQEMQILIYDISRLLDELAPDAVSFFSFKKKQRKVEASVKSLRYLQEDFFEHVVIAQAKTILPSARMLSTDSFKIIDEIETFTDDVRLCRCDLVQQMGRITKRLGPFLIENNYAENKKDVERLAEILGSAKPSSGILDFVGFRKDSSRNARSPYELVFSVPEDTSLKGSLQKALQESVSSPPSLNSRVAMCTQLASAVLHVHGELGMVHKNINSNNIVLAEVTTGSGAAITTDSALFLTNWRYARDESASTDLSGASNWASRLYQHPERQVPRAEAKYFMGHDIYSLGVCMLEVLLWKPLINSTNGEPKPSMLLQDMVKLSKVQFAATDIDMEDEEDEHGESSEERVLRHNLVNMDGKVMQNMIKKMAETTLPAAVGDTLTQVVVTCLTCLEGNPAPVSFSQGDRVEIGMKFITFIKSLIEAVQV